MNKEDRKNITAAIEKIEEAKSMLEETQGSL